MTLSKPVLCHVKASFTFSIATALGLGGGAGILPLECSGEVLFVPIWLIIQPRTSSPKKTDRQPPWEPVSCCFPQWGQVLASELICVPHSLQLVSATLSRLLGFTNECKASRSENPCSARGQAPISHRSKSCQYRWNRLYSWDRWNWRISNLLVFSGFDYCNSPASTILYHAIDTRYFRI